MEKKGGFKDLDCWKVARELRIFIANQVLPALPKDERYRLGDQMIRSARSITANIAEGFGRFHYLDNWKFCSNARGSCYELLDHLITATDEKLVESQLVVEGEARTDRTLNLLNGYMTYLRRAAAAQSTKRPPGGRPTSNE